MANEEYKELLALIAQAKEELADMVGDIAGQINSLNGNLDQMKMKMDQVDYEMNYIVTSTETLKSGIDAMMKQFASLASGNTNIGNTFMSDLAEYFF